MPQVKPVPEGMHTVTPHLVCAGDAIEFYKRAFGAAEMARLAGPQGKLAHAMIRIGDSVVMLVDEFPERGALSPTRKTRQRGSYWFARPLMRSSAGNWDG